MMAADTIFVRTVRTSQLTASVGKSVCSEVCQRAVRLEEIDETDNSPGPFVGWVPSAPPASCWVCVDLVRGEGFEPSNP